MAKRLCKSWQEFGFVSVQGWKHTLSVKLCTDENCQGGKYPQKIELLQCQTLILAGGSRMRIMVRIAQVTLSLEHWLCFALKVNHPRNTCILIIPKT